ncbi:MAG: hypothetical protein K8S55_11665 [Phycisphaerae bacterium]|nr:hypothetical protein [Phycisphaerae bacterium]
MAGSKAPRRVALAAGLVGLGVIFLCVWLGCGGNWSRIEGRGGFVQALGNGQFRLFLWVATGSVLLLAVLVGWLVRLGGNLRRRLGRQRGTVIIEFAMVLPIAMVISLIMVQSSLLMGGFLCVNYASYCAARSAIVYIPQQTDDEAVNQVNHLSDENLSGKLWRIKSAAAWAVMPTGNGENENSSDYAEVLSSGLQHVYGEYNRSAPGWVAELIGRKLGYAEEHTSVELSPPYDEESMQYGEHEDIQVTVRHNLCLSVPYAGRILAALDSEHSMDLGDGRYAVEVTVPCTLTNEGTADTIDVENFPD